EPSDAPAAPVAASVPMSAEPVAAAAPNAARGTSRLQSRIEPTFGRLS
ncbi:cell division protein FtsW, partial [Stenotrophomonas maltophilia]